MLHSWEELAIKYVKHFQVQLTFRLKFFMNRPQNERVPFFSPRRKLQARLAEAEETIESLNQKVIALEKTKQRLATEVEDLQLEVDRANAIANAAEKKAKAIDKIIGEWKLKVRRES